MIATYQMAVKMALLGVGCLVVALVWGGAAWLALWPAVAFLLVAVAFAGVGVRVLGKRTAGQLRVPNAVMLAPYFGLTYLLHTIHCAVSREAPSHEVAPGLWLGRRPRSQDLPAGTRLVVDLTSEFHEPADVRAGREYLCLPILDAGVPRDEQFKELLDRLAGEAGPIYVHCASGHGRSAMVAAGLLIRRDLATNVQEAEAMLRKVRRGVRLSRCQRAMVSRVLALHRQSIP